MIHISRIFEAPANSQNQVKFQDWQVKILLNNKQINEFE